MIVEFDDRMLSPGLRQEGEVCGPAIICSRDLEPSIRNRWTGFCKLVREKGSGHRLMDLKVIKSEDEYICNDKNPHSSSSIPSSRPRAFANLSNLKVLSILSA